MLSKNLDCPDWFNFTRETCSLLKFIQDVRTRVIFLMQTMHHSYQILDITYLKTLKDASVSGIKEIIWKGKTIWQTLMKSKITALKILIKIKIRKKKRKKHWIECSTLNSWKVFVFATITSVRTTISLLNSHLKVMMRAVQFTTSSMGPISKPLLLIRVLLVSTNTLQMQRILRRIIGVKR